MWARLSDIGQIASLPDRLMRKRFHAGSISVVRQDIGLASSSRIAAAYAQKLCAEIDSVAIAELYLYFHDRGPQRCSMDRVVRAFQAYCNLFPVELRQETPDLAATIDETRQRLRRRCLARLRRTWFSPPQALVWARAMRGFDPVRGTLSGTSLRLMRKGVRGISRVALGSGA